MGVQNFRLEDVRQRDNVEIPCDRYRQRVEIEIAILEVIVM